MRGGGCAGSKGHAINMNVDMMKPNLPDPVEQDKSVVHGVASGAGKASGPAVPATTSTGVGHDQMQVSPAEVSLAVSSVVAPAPASSASAAPPTALSMAPAAAAPSAAAPSAAAAATVPAKEAASALIVAEDRASRPTKLTSFAEIPETAWDPVSSGLFNMDGSPKATKARIPFWADDQGEAHDQRASRARESRRTQNSRKSRVTESRRTGVTSAFEAPVDRKSRLDRKSRMSRASLDWEDVEEEDESQSGMIARQKLKRIFRVVVVLTRMRALEFLNSEEIEPPLPPSLADIPNLEQLVLEAIPELRSKPRKIQKTVARSCYSKSYHLNQVVVPWASELDAMYIVVSGSFTTHVRAVDPTGETVVEALKAGQVPAPAPGMSHAHRLTSTSTTMRHVACRRPSCYLARR